MIQKHEPHVSKDELTEYVEMKIADLVKAYPVRDPTIMEVAMTQFEKEIERINEKTQEEGESYRIAQYEETLEGFIDHLIAHVEAEILEKGGWDMAKGDSQIIMLEGLIQ